ncbi:MAG: DNA polymerase III subunit alpha [Pelagibacteraceae bacterium TMED237]|nr:MAG: DNA polymerase III subunit alpha [Pelagibacteraceae bacterium TMED237]
MIKPFIHLRSLSSYSLSESTLKIKNLVSICKKFNMPAIALTDNNNMFGVFEFSQECISNNIQPIIGSSINLLDVQSDNYISQLSFLVKNEIGYKNLLHLSSLSHLNNNKKIGINISQLEDYSSGLYCYIGGQYNPLLMLRKQKKNLKVASFIENLKKFFNDNLLFEIQRINDVDIDNFEFEFIELAKKNNIPLIGSNNIKYGDQNDNSAHDALLCIAQKSTVNNTNRIQSNENIYFKSSEEMQEVFKDIPEIIKNNLNIAITCNFFPEETNPKLPKFENNLNLSAEDYLIKFSKEGLDNKINKYKILNSKKYLERLNYETEIIIRMGFAGYFLIVADFVNWAKNNLIPVGPGRGSGAGSVVAWSLGITDLDPLKYDLLFERFLNPERVSMPDFDIDFCQNRRDEVIEYVSNKYGNECVAHIITFGTLASRAAVRDIGRVLEVPYGEVDSFAKLIPFNPSNPLTLSESIKSERALQEKINTDERISNVVDISLRIEGTHRHASTHAAGVVIGHEKISKVVPLYKDQNTNSNATQFSMKYVEKAGLIKFDFLGLTTLSIIDDCVKLIKKNYNNFNIDNLKLDDKKTYEQLSRGETVGIFQLESSGMGSVLRQLQPDKFEEIIAVVALFRPGPMDNIPSFCNRKHGREKIDYMHPLLENVLKETYGIIVYQEQVMQIAQVLSNYSLGEADLLRRAMGKKIQKEMDLQKNRFIDGAIKNEINKKEASKLFDLVDKFAGYGFNKSHAAAYALISYQTAYLKANFPHEFITATLNYSIDRTDKIILLKKEIERLNINFLKPDINYSDSIFSIEDSHNKKSIRFGLGAIKGVGIKSISSMIEERNNNGKFKNIIDFMTRVKNDIINKRQLEKLIQAGAFDSIEINRSKLFTNVSRFVELFAGEKFQNQNLLFEDKEISFDDSNLFNQNFESWTNLEALKNELEVIGFYFSDHPLRYFPKLFFETQKIKNHRDLINNDTNSIILCGAVLDIKERSNKDGKKYAFITVSEKETQYELTIFSENLYQYRHLLKEGNLLIFSIDIIRNNSDERFIIKNIKSLNKIFDNFNIKFNVYASFENIINNKNKIFIKNSNSQHSIDLFINIEDKLVNFDFNKYSIKSFKVLDDLKDAKLLDYSLDIS